MQSGPKEIYPVSAVREMDRIAIEDEGIPGYTLMTRAGEAAVREAIARYPDSKRWQVFCGAGNNAGDGYVVARLAADGGIAATVIAVADPEKLSGDAATAYRDFEAAGGVALRWPEEPDADAELLIDALLGSGLERDVDGSYAEAVAAINAHRSPVMALDIPAGIHGDTGEAMGVAVTADITVTFVGLKTGLFLADGAGCAGDIVFAGLDIPEHCRDRSLAVLRRIRPRSVRAVLPPRPRQAHKGDFGHVLVVGGGAGMPGAVRLCGEAALRSGAGRVSLATEPAHAAAIVASCPELMSHGITSTADLAPLLDAADVVAFGPGLGRSEWAAELYESVSARDIPSVWDADALNMLAKHGGESEHRVITPHPGEAARLLGNSAREIQADRIGAVRVLQHRYGGVAVLKGAGTLVCASRGVPRICTEGNPGMAAPGMGDVLTGVIAALLAQGLSAGGAAAIGVEAHALAGDRAARAGQRGLMASDLIGELRHVLN